MEEQQKILVYGYGNPGRQDDGLGNALITELRQWAEKEGWSHIQFESNYQLNIEDAEMISHFDKVFFVDASVEEDVHDFALTSLTGMNEMTFTTHAASPGYVVHLCSKLFGDIPEAYLLHIRGYEWEFKESLSIKASENLNKAIGLMKEILEAPSSVRNKITQNSELKTHN